MRIIFTAASVMALAACNVSSSGSDKNHGSATAENSASAQGENLADAMRSNDSGTADSTAADIPDAEERPVMQAQVVLDREGFGPGVIDGKDGQSTENALRGYQEANSLEVSGELDEATKKSLAQWENIKATRVVRIPAEWGEIEFQKVPDSAPDQAKLDQLGYNNLDEKIAERFHTTVDVLKKLNPDGKPAGMESGDGEDTQSPSAANTQSPSDNSDSANKSESPKSTFAAGKLIRVPNIGADKISPGAVTDKGWQETLASLGVGTDQPEATRIVVSKSAGTLKAFDKSDKLVALFTVTTGSKNDPLPLGNWGINGVAHNPPFSYDPKLFWDVSDDKDEQKLPPGPNGPVGVVWIDLTKEHYGIHGTPAPETIGRAQSHGCVRLTNWDAARVAGMVNGSTKVLFEA